MHVRFEVRESVGSSKWLSSRREPLVRSAGFLWVRRYRYCQAHRPTTLERMPYLAHGEHGGMLFIFKVLSASNALPLQAHPPSERVARLKGVDTHASWTLQ
ncbi:hypothetical protein K437DRAFT_265575 [Tilletiaria anomala UBC 951]|uniref:Uncharacterized protein n=1 Tax=Tilletiaria anomala (strain ATCC 24038 / CBS 436.72 / UBC 951) TaxID=1037660 RepID=A0A066WR74_TILAU|nr:uncharacterized protein K437DRAFT_265575 [Tilletiaria anomala UBC 951]KDN53504.1 hypothetical protein K437DRAFT_265575 [Tilletiaria anomala UBC 951]